MIFDPARTRLSILLDVRSPLAYLALHPALAFVEAEGVEADWLPLTAPPLRAPSPADPGDDRSVRHRRFRAEAIAREVETYGRVQGLAIRDLYRDGPADVANLGWLWVREHRRDRLPVYLVELFRAYWAEALDPDDREAIAAHVGRCGGDPDHFLAWAEAEGPRAAVRLVEELRDFGLYQVPAYVVEDEVFYGRQHLPMIRWILAGRSGPVPI